MLASRLGGPVFWRDQRWFGRPARLQAYGRVDSMVGATHPEEHRRQRKMLAPAFTERAVVEQEPIVQRYVGTPAERLRQKAMEAGSHEKSDSGAVVDLKDWFTYLTFDVFADLAFGESFECLDNSQYHPCKSRPTHLFGFCRLDDFAVLLATY